MITRLRPVLSPMLAASALVLALAAPAAAAEVKLKDGSSITADRLTYTYMYLVVLTPDNDMRLLPNDAVESVDGIPFHRAYWGEQPGHSDDIGGPTGQQGSAGNVVAGLAGTAVERLMPLKPGTFRRYDLEQVRTTWVRHGKKMERRETVEADGSVRENVTGPVEGGGAVNVLEIITEKQAGRPAHEVTLRHRIEGRADGVYLTAESMQDKNLQPTLQEEKLAEPPRLWPQSLVVGQTWVVGPFERLGLGQVMRMEVVGVEPITVPAGAYVEAFKIQGKGNVFGGSQQLKHGRLVTSNGNIETTTWFVPGIGPVRELSKIHVHQSFFPFRDKTGREVPLVVEEEATRTLAEFHLGQ